MCDENKFAIAKLNAENLLANLKDSVNELRQALNNITTKEILEIESSIEVLQNHFDLFVFFQRKQCELCLYYHNKYIDQNREILEADKFTCNLCKKNICDECFNTTEELCLHCAAYR
jgi:hypothetical protein